MADENEDITADPKPADPNRFRSDVDPRTGKRRMLRERDWAKIQQEMQRQFAAQATPQPASQNPTPAPQPQPQPQPPSQNAPSVPPPRPPDDDRTLSLAPGEAQTEAGKKKIREWHERQTPRIERERAEAGLPPGDPKQVAGGGTSGSLADTAALNSAKGEILDRLDKLIAAVKEISAFGAG